ncbi:MAG: hypothetical protein ABFD54_09960 [Armatimonadota bacterium]|nr:hypothetical protein [bacterium]
MTRVNWWLIMGTISIISLCCGCGPSYLPSQSVTKRDLVGSYYVRYEPYRGRYLGHETLTLRSNGTYQQIFVTSCGRVSKNTGTWRLEQDYNEPNLWLEHAGQYLNEWHDQLATHPQYEGMSAPVNRRGNRIWITVDDDMDIYYQKKK